MNKYYYEPSEEEINNAEAMMNGEEQKMSKNRWICMMTSSRLHSDAWESKDAKYVLDLGSNEPRLEFDFGCIWKIKVEHEIEEKELAARRQQTKEEVERKIQYAKAALKLDGESKFEYFTKVLSCYDSKKDLAMVVHDGVEIGGVVQNLSEKNIRIGRFEFFSNMCGVVNFPISEEFDIKNIENIRVVRDGLNEYLKEEKDKWLKSIR